MVINTAGSGAVTRFAERRPPPSRFPNDIKLDPADHARAYGDRH
jgi:hypothetical protein